MDNAPVASDNTAAAPRFPRRLGAAPRPPKTDFGATASAATPLLPSDAAVRPMLLLNNLDIGGAEIAVLNLAIGLMALGCKPLVYGWRRGGALEPRFRDAGVEIEVPDEPARSGWRRLAVPRLLAQAVERHGITVLHAHLSDSVTWAALLQSRVGVPCVVSHHTTDLIDTVGIGRPLYGWARRRLLSASSRAVGRNIAVSNAVRDRLIGQTGIPERQVAVIENGLPLPPAERVARACAERRAHAAGHHATDGPLIVAVGRVTQEKGFHTLIEAAPAIRAVYPRARIAIVGDGPHRDALLQLRARLGLEAVVDLPGFTDDVGAYLARADAFAAPSHIEGLPMAVIEAMSWGTPIVVSDIPGHRTLVEDGVTGVFVPMRDPAALADALVRTLAGGAEAEARVARALTVVQQNYSAEAMARRHLDLYRAAMADRQPRPRQSRSPHFQPPQSRP